MKTPKQLPAVDRNSRKGAAVPVGANVSPSLSWKDVIKAVPDVVGGVGHVTGWW